MAAPLLDADDDHDEDGYEGFRDWDSWGCTAWTSYSGTASEIQGVLDSWAYDLSQEAQTNSEVEVGQNTIDCDLEGLGPCLVHLRQEPAQPYQQDLRCQGVLDLAAAAAEVAAMNCRGADTNLVLAGVAAAATHQGVAAVHHRTNLVLSDSEEAEDDVNSPSDSAAACTEAAVVDAGSSSGFPACTVAADRKAAALAAGLVPLVAAASCCSC